MEEIKDIFRKLGDKVIKKMNEENERNEDSSWLTHDKINDQLKSIARCEYELDLLLSKTDEVGGFGSYYPKKCLEHLKLMRDILEMELKE